VRTSNHPRDYLEQMGAVVALVGRLVDIAASLTHIGVRVGSDDREGLRALAASIGSIRAALESGNPPNDIELSDASEHLGGVPLLREMEKTILLIPMAFSGSESLSDLGLPPSDDQQPTTFLAPDAFSNLDHLKFGLRGALPRAFAISSTMQSPGPRLAQRLQPVC
jgi:multidrug resistance protein MdtO